MPISCIPIWHSLRSSPRHTHRNSFRITEAPVMEKIMTKEQTAAWDVFVVVVLSFFFYKEACIYKTKARDKGYVI